MLWHVHYLSSYYDEDPRMPGDCPVSESWFVLGRSKEEVLEKLKGELKKIRRQRDKQATETIDATVVTPEELIPARDVSSDRGLHGWSFTQNLAKVQLFHKDAKRYRLTVCLVPA